jgi:hypothetical protein
MRVVPATAITFTVYEKVSSYLMEEEDSTTQPKSDQKSK